jgi:hypothetical protein
MDNLEKKLVLLERTGKLNKQEIEDLRNILNLERDRAVLGMKGDQHHRKEVDAIKKKLKITEDLYDYEYSQKKKLYALERAEIAAGKTGREKKRYFKQYEKMEYKSFFRLTADKRRAMRKEILEKQIGIRRIHELEKVALRKEERDQKAFARKYKIKEKGEVVAKGPGRVTGQIAGDVDRAIETAFKPFHNKSLNPLKWLKMGSDVAKDLEESGVNFKEWGKALENAIKNRKARAGKEIKARERAAEEEEFTKKGWKKDKSGQWHDKSGKFVKGANEKDKKNIQKGFVETLGEVAKKEGKSRAQSRGRKDIQKGLTEVFGKSTIETSKKPALLKRVANAVGGLFGVATEDVTKKTTGGGRRPKGAPGGAGIGNLGSFMAATKGLGMLVKVVEGLAFALGILSKASWIFAIISAIAAMVSKMVELDDYLKKLNKTFATMAGPTIGMKDIGKEMDTFNDALFDIRRNMALGLKGEDIQNMFKAVSGAGMAPQVLAAKAGDYDKAITDIRKSSVALGISFEDMGKNVTEQMLNLRSSFDDTKDALLEMGYNASKAGINANKFYSAIENSISALSFFGNFTKIAASRLTTFIEQGTLGMKDATDAANSYMQVFQKMDWKDLQKVFALAGHMGSAERATHPLVEMMRKTQEEIIGTLTNKDSPLGKLVEKRKVLTVQIEEARKGGDTSTVEELSKTLNETNKGIKGYENRIKGFEGAVIKFTKEGDVAALSQYKELLAPNFAKIRSLIQENTGLTGEQKAAQIEMLKNIMKLDENFIRQMDMLDGSIKNSSDDLISSLSGSNVDLISNTKGSLEAMQKLVDIGSKPNADMVSLGSAFSTLANRIYGDTEEGKNFAKSMIENLKMGPERIEKVQKVLADIKTNLATAGDPSKDANTRATAEAAAKSAAQALQMTDTEKATYVDKLNELNVKTSKDAAKKNEDSWNTFIKKTVSLKDRYEIAKEAVNYQLAKVMQTPADLLNDMVAGIASDVSILASDKREAAKRYEAEFLSRKPVSSLSGAAVTGGFGTATASTPALNAKSMKELIDEQAEKMQEYYKKDYTDYDPTKDTQKLSAEAKADKEKRGAELAAIEKEIKLRTGEKDKIIVATAKIEAARIAQDKAAQAEADREQAKIVAESKGYAKGEQTKAETEALSNVKKDARGTGLTLLDKDDYAINPTTGVSKPKGKFAEEVLSKMLGLDNVPGFIKGGSTGSTYSINLGGVNFNGDPGDKAAVADAGQKIADMIEQAIRQYDHEKQYA